MRLGKLTESVLKRSVLIPASTKAAHLLSVKKPGMDSAAVAWEGGALVLASDTEVIEPEPSSGDFAGDPVYPSVLLCCTKVCNNLYAAGAEPVTFQVQLVLPPQLEEAEMKTIMLVLRGFCDREGITISGGQTETSAAVSRPVLAITAIGKKSEEFPVQSQVKKVRPGDAVVMSKYLAVEGTWRLVRTCGEQMKERFAPGFLEKGLEFFNWISVKREAETAKNYSVCAMHDVSRGGLFAALWELGARENLGLTVDFHRIPVRQETIEYCEALDRNPYCLAGTGSLLMVARDGEALVRALEAAGVPAAVIGYLTAGNDRMVVNGDEARNIDPPALDELYRSGDYRVERGEDSHYAEK